ncbi:DUF5313 family protein [Lolliginicoccus levis]|uniref:DUF5313 family protein n=1 Tax=Lolliginicoccus levis TaxID=2919542 RepID=UPI00241E85E2|nr:DUF5313 family protein [Lolliginicoccus levis]
MARPTARERIGYAFGRVLPPHLHDWVEHDLTGPGATRRYLIRGLLPLLPLLALFLLVPGPLWVIGAMMMLLLIPYVYFLIALTYVYRRHRLISHDLDPGLMSRREQERKDRERADYERRFGH